MRINKYLASATGYSRREVDKLIEENRIKVNGELPQIGQSVDETDSITVDGANVQQVANKTTIMLNKPVGYVCSRDGQGSQTIYDLLPVQYERLKPVGRLDKDSSGLILLTDDGDLAHQLTHPSFEKTKVYKIELGAPLNDMQRKQIEQGIHLEDGISTLALKGGGTAWEVTMHEGRNRQIRRTFEAIGYQVTKLHRTGFGEYSLGDLGLGKFKAA